MVNDFGFDVVLNYCIDDFKVGFKVFVLDGIDLYFENVGGELFNVVFKVMKLFGCMIFCGFIFVYNGEIVGVLLDMMVIVCKWLIFKGFVMLDYYD